MTTEFSRIDGEQEWELTTGFSRIYGEQEWELATGFSRLDGEQGRELRPRLWELRPHHLKQQEHVRGKCCVTPGHRCGELRQVKIPEKCKGNNKKHAKNDSLKLIS